MISKILILRFSSLGDILMTTPMVRAVRKAFPQAQIAMAVREDFADLIRFNPHLDQRFYLSRGDGMEGLKRFRDEVSGRFDLVYDAHRSLRTRFLMPQLAAPHKAYFDKHYFKRSLALTFKLPLLDTKRSLERFCEPLAAYGVQYDGGGPEMAFPAGLTAELRTKLKLPAGKWIGLVPSAQWPGKRWPVERFRAVAERLITESPHHLLVFGGKDDRFCQDIVDNLPAERITNLQGKASILEGAALLAACELVVANDTGLLHVADAVGVPAVAILGPTSAEMGCAPYHPLSRIAEVALWCRPCSKNGQAPCIRSRRWCLERVTVDQVMALVKEILQRSGKA